MLLFQSLFDTTFTVGNILTIVMIFASVLGAYWLIRLKIVKIEAIQDAIDLRITVLERDVATNRQEVISDLKQVIQEMRETNGEIRGDIKNVSEKINDLHIKIIQNHRD